MAKIELKNLVHIYKKGREETYALKGLNLTFEDGIPSALLGPSGCGKTTLLNILSGLLMPTKGKVFFNGRDVTNLPPEQRNVAQVFQFPIVYDSMDVYGNLAFPLKNRRLAGKEIDIRVREVAEILDLEPYLKVSPKSLGPDKRQLIAVGRCLVRKDTEVILLDEPMTQIDIHQRGLLRRELSKVQAELNITTIYVTHDQYEALSFADWVVVMNDGYVVQEGTPDELYNNPKTPFVGYFIGSPGMNILECELIDNFLVVDREYKITISDILRNKIETYGTKFKMGIRPEFVLCDTKQHEEWVKMRITAVEKHGEFNIITLKKNVVILKSQTPSNLDVKEGTEVWVSFLEEKIKIYFNDKLIN